MIELIVGTYGFVCWLLFAKLKLIPINTYTVVTAILGGVLILVMLLLFLTLYHPFAKDGRLYAYTTPIVPEVRGIVVSVPVVQGTMVEKGDVLFQVDPQPYRFEVERLQGALDQANTEVAQLEQRLQAATARSKNAQAMLEASESELDLQTREEIEQARAVRSQAVTAVDFAQLELSRSEEQLAAGIIAQQERDVFKQRFDTASAQLSEAEAALRQAEQRLGSGSSRIESAREELAAAEAQEREVRLELESESAGLNPEVRQILAELQNAQFDLEQTTVRAPARGFASQVFLRPGQMAVPLPAFPTMIFVHADKYELIASFPQNTIQYLEPGLDAELAFKMYPGKIFKGKVKGIAQITPEGQFIPSGQVRNVSPTTSTKIPVIFEYGPDVEELNLPIGAQVGVAVYTHHIHAISIVRKILLRIKSWENYMFALPGLSH